MSRTLDIARDHYYRGIRQRGYAVNAATGYWGRLNPKNIEESFWGIVHPRLVETVTMFQAKAVQLAEDYAYDVTGIEPVAELDPDPFSGIAADGRSLESLLAVPLDDALAAYESTGLTQAFRETAARQAGAATLSRIVASEVADAGRTADGVAIVSRPEVEGFTRVLTLPSCPKCVILAGRVYRWNEGFARHPGCDCRHVPVIDMRDVPDDITTDPEAAVKAGQVTGLSKADQQAIEDGADVSQIVNAVRGTSTAADGTKTTTEGMGKRGFARMRLGKGKPRLRPETIYREANGDRELAIQMLRDHGYIL